MDGEECRGGRAGRGQLFKHQRGVQPGQPQAAIGLGRVQAAKAQLARGGQCLAREGAFGIPAGGVGREFTRGKLPRTLLEGALVFRQFEVHGLALTKTYGGVDAGGDTAVIKPTLGDRLGLCVEQHHLLAIRPQVAQLGRA